MNENKKVLVDKQEDKISVIIPVHNGEKWIERTIKGILSQTYNNIEIVLVENNSKDNSWSICSSLAKKNLQVKAIQSFEIGTSLARKKGVLASTGKYIIFSDQDDTYLNKDCIFNMYKAIREDDVQIVQFGYWKNYIGGIKRKILLTDEKKILSKELPV